jgi:hypothetical protein
MVLLFIIGQIEFQSTANVLRTNDQDYKTGLHWSSVLRRAEGASHAILSTIKFGQLTFEVSHETPAHPR